LSQSTFQLIKFAANIEFLSDQYLTLTEEVHSAVFKEKGSKFMGYAKSIINEEEILEFLFQIKKLHPKASHHCYAYRMGKNKNNYRAFDDGEPSGTAGLPILGQLDSFGLSNSMVIVVRYFGGTKLGTTGLIKAYKSSAKLTIESSKVIEGYWTRPLSIRFPHINLNHIMEFIKKNKHIDILKTEIDLECRIELSVRESEFEIILEKLKGFNLLSFA
jgi:uncharacterized YigZ family protein